MHGKIPLVYGGVIQITKSFVDLIINAYPFDEIKGNHASSKYEMTKWHLYYFPNKSLLASNPKG